MKKLNLLFSILIVGCALCCAGMTSAAEVTYSFSGTVGAITDTSGQNYVPGGLTGSTPFVGTFSFNNSAPGSGGFYSGTALDMSVDVTIGNQYHYHDDVASALDGIDFIQSGSNPTTYTFELFKRGPDGTTDYSPFPPFSHFDFIGGTVTTNSLANVVLGSSGSGGVSDQQSAGSAYYYIAGDNFTVQSVPEPATAVLLAAGMAGALVCGWKRTRTRRLG
jgi:hypothetical protein